MEYAPRYVGARPPSLRSDRRPALRGFFLFWLRLATVQTAPFVAVCTVAALRPFSKAAAKPPTLIKKAPPRSQRQSRAESAEAAPLQCPAHPPQAIRRRTKKSPVNYGGIPYRHTPRILAKKRGSYSDKAAFLLPRKSRARRSFVASVTPLHCGKKTQVLKIEVFISPPLRSGLFSRRFRSRFTIFFKKPRGYFTAFVFLRPLFL